MIKTLKNKLLVLTLVMLVILCFLMTTISLLEFSLNKVLKKNNCNMSVTYFSEKIRKSVTHSQENVLDMAVMGELLYKEQALALNQDNLDFITSKIFEKESLSIGGGIWFEPSINHNKRLCSYSFKKDGKIVIDSKNFMNDKYDYPNQMWYKVIKANVSKSSPTIWTKPYYDESGTHALMTTVGAAIYDKNGKIVGLTTVDWDLNSIIKNLSSIQLTPKSFVLFADEDDDFIISLTDKTVNENDYIGKSLKTIPWYSENLKNGKEVKYNNTAYISFQQKLDENKMIVIVNVPKNELYLVLKRYLKTRLSVLYIISLLITIFIFVSLTKQVSKPINYLIKTAEEIGNGNLDEEIKIESPEEFAKLANSFNKMTKDIKTKIIENSEIKSEKEKIEQELNIAKSIQHSVLPRKFPPYPNRNEFDIYASMKTSKMVGGDFYDFFFIDDNHLIFLIADVSGKGVPAALFMMQTITLIKNRSKRGASTAQILTDVNKRLCENKSENLFVTMFLGILNTQTGKINCTNAGHNQPLVKKKDSVEYLNIEPDLVLGVDSDILYKNHELRLNKDETLFLYTDGVTEAMNQSDELFGEDRLSKMVNNTENNVERILENIQFGVEKFMKNCEQSDDITMLALKYKNEELNNENPDSKKLIISAQTKNLDAVSFWLKTICEEEKLSDEILNKLTLVVEEIFVNVANYAYPPKTGDIEIYFRKSAEDELEFKFVDNGTPFNPLENADPNIELSAEDRPIGGLGIFMVKNIMSSVEYEYKNNQNILTTTMKV